jgi:hypothetical protein
MVGYYVAPYRHLLQGVRVLEIDVKSGEYFDHNPLTAGAQPRYFRQTEQRRCGLACGVVRAPRARSDFRAFEGSNGFEGEKLVW